MKIELTDAQVKDAIYDWLASRMTVMPPAADVKINKLYLDGSGNFEAVVDFPISSVSEK